MDAYEQAKHTARVFLSEARSRRAGRGYWFSVNGAESALRRAIHLNPQLRRQAFPLWAESLGMTEGVAVVHRETGMRGVVHVTMGLYLTLAPGPFETFWRAADFMLAPASAAAPAQMELFA
ncbi:TPA: hypothetical protein ACGCGJ_000441 [Stenotrophomonas maltophilia]|uniref:hypothetical protein n=1 Tax=Stenotrophomonas TaxID=40323 RepID=UPI000DA8895D|nr:MULTISPECIES: hypothetical protein [Stenotrophomonas]